jgi:hypothetical protein
VDHEAPVSPETGAGTLLGGILRDAQTLLAQQLALFRTEVKQELRQLKSGLVSLGIGIGIAAVGGLLLLGMVVHLLAAKTQIPLWGCYGIVGGALSMVGIAFLIGGRKSVADVHLAPPPATAQALKENVEWLKNLKPAKTAEPTT